MTLLESLHALHRAPLVFRKEGGSLKVLPPLPGRSFAPLLAHLEATLLGVLEDGERVVGSALLWDLHRLAALSAYIWGAEEKGEVVLTLCYPPPPFPDDFGLTRNYLMAWDNLIPHLVWTRRALPLPYRLLLSPTTGRWTLDLWAGWEVAVEAHTGEERYALFAPRVFYPVFEEDAAKYPHPERTTLWVPGSHPFTVKGWEGVLSYLWRGEGEP